MEVLRIEPLEPCGLRLVGELDMATAPRLVEALAAVGCANGEILLDVSELTFIDSSGVHTLFEHTKSDGSAQMLVLVNPLDTVRRTLELLMVDEHPRVQVRSGA